MNLQKGSKLIAFTDMSPDLKTFFKTGKPSFKVLLLSNFWKLCMLFPLHYILSFKKKVPTFQDVSFKPSDIVIATCLNNFYSVFDSPSSPSIFLWISHILALLTRFKDVLQISPIDYWISLCFPGQSLWKLSAHISVSAVFVKRVLKGKVPSCWICAVPNKQKGDF